MATSLKQTGLQFPDNIIQTSNAANTLIGTAGGSFATAIMNTQNITPYRRCAVIMNDGRVRCWGYGEDSFSGFQRGGDNPYPIDISFPHTFPGASSVTHSGTSSLGVFPFRMRLLEILLHSGALADLLLQKHQGRGLATA